MSGVVAVGAVGVSIAFDEDIRSGAKGIGRGTGRDIQDAATTVSWVMLAGLYAVGLGSEGEDLRHHALTGAECCRWSESAGIR